MAERDLALEAAPSPPRAAMAGARGPSAAQVRAFLHVLAALLGVGGLALLLHRSQYPLFWRYSKLYLLGLGAYACVLLAVLALAWLGAPLVARLLAVRAVAAATLLGGGVATAVLIAEGALALLPPHYWNLSPAAIDGPIFARQEPPLHHVRPAGREHTVVSPYGEFSVHVRINSDGLRDVERSVVAPEGVTRVLVLGDSMVEAVQVPLEETFVKRTERHLEDRTGRLIDVINAGVSSYSPTAEYLMLRHKGLKYRPDVVVLVFFPADVGDDWAYRRDVVFDARGVPVERLPRDESVRANLRETLIARSRLLTFTVGNLRLLRTNPLADLSVSIFQPEYGERERAAWAVSTASILATRDLARDHGAEFVLVALPYPVQVSPNEGVSGSRRLKVPDILRTSTRPQQVLADLARENRMHYLDMLPVLRASGVHPLYFDYDLHFTAKGHEVTARALAAFLLERGLVPARAAGQRP